MGRDWLRWGGVGKEVGELGGGGCINPLCVWVEVVLSTKRTVKRGFGVISNSVGEDLP